MKDDELLYLLALTRLPGLGIIGAHQLLRCVPNATYLFQNRNNLKKEIPSLSPRLLQALDCPDVLRQCEAELNFADKNKIACLTANDTDYPSRLRECDDAPLVLFYKGNADLNRLHVVNLVGTRNATNYGKEICERFIKDLKELLPDTLIVSGLAYGIDIAAHRAPLLQGLPTVGVLAHGLDRIYPAVHRKTAAEMIEQGGLLTEFMSGTTPERQNFIKRNRIVAGMCDATIVVESAEKGGALITADIAESYNRECFAFPGRISDPYSAGCNHLIQNNRASLLLDAEGLVKAMNWNAVPVKPVAIQRQLFVDLSPEEETIVQQLQQHSDGLQINTLIVTTNIPINRMSSLLFELEMKGILRTYAGGMYKLI